MKIYLMINFDYFLIDCNFERKFIDKQWTQLKLIGIDLGTFGTKGRVQLIIPDKSICFNDNSDAEVETISMCTSIIILILKNFLKILKIKMLFYIGMVIKNFRIQYYLIKIMNYTKF